MSHDEKHLRQSFLGPESQNQIRECRLAIVGLGGGGSHVVQQCAHIGFLNYLVLDPDIVKYVNLNRLVGATSADVKRGVPKIDVARRVIRGLEQDAKIVALQDRWQDGTTELAASDIIIGCLDGFSERDQLEAFARRYLIPFIDVGMDVHAAPNEPPMISGQVILSMPGHSCMRCMGFLTEEKLAREAARYGAAGGRPQVVWPNGVLASTAVGIAMNLLTDWSRSVRDAVYLCYDGNRGTMMPHVRMDYRPATCEHYPLDKVGDPVFRPV